MFERIKTMFGSNNGFQFRQQQPIQQQTQQPMQTQGQPMQTTQQIPGNGNNQSGFPAGNNGGTTQETIAPRVNPFELAPQNNNEQQRLSPEQEAAQHKARQDTIQQIVSGYQMQPLPQEAMTALQSGDSSQLNAHFESQLRGVAGQVLDSVGQLLRSQLTQAIDASVKRAVQTTQNMQSIKDAVSNVVSQFETLEGQDPIVVASIERAVQAGKTLQEAAKITADYFEELGIPKKGSNFGRPGTGSQRPGSRNPMEPVDFEAFLGAGRN